jgi:hypothetical protein
MARVVKLIAIGAALAALLSGCGGSTGASTAPASPNPKHRPAAHALFERSYVVAAAHRASGPDPFREDDSAGVLIWQVRVHPDTFSHSISWGAGCNDMNADLKTEPHRLRLHGGSETTIGCQEWAEREDDWFSRFLRADPFWRGSHGRLILHNRLGTVTLKPGRAKG